MSVKVAIPAMLLLMVCACQDDTLEQGVPQLVVEAEPSPSQTRLQEPEGLDLGDIPLARSPSPVFDLRTARPMH